MWSSNTTCALDLILIQANGFFCITLRIYVLIQRHRHQKCSNTHRLPLLQILKHLMWWEIYSISCEKATCPPTHLPVHVAKLRSIIHQCRPQPKCMTPQKLAVHLSLKVPEGTAHLRLHHFRLYVIERSYFYSTV